MRILIVSNLYPPYFVGGYEIRCRQVAEALQQAGHEVEVLTSVYGLPRLLLAPRPRREMISGVVVHRCLGLYTFPPYSRLRPWTFFQAWAELRDARAFQRLVERYRPQVISWWGMYGLSKCLLPLPRLWRLPDVHWIEHWWMIAEYAKDGAIASRFWNAVWDGDWGPRPLRPLFRVVGRAWEARTRKARLATRDFTALPSHICFVSEYMRRLHREAGLEFPSSEIIHGGVSPEVFQAPARRPNGSSPLRLLYAGQIDRSRGLHTVIDALSRLEPPIRQQLTLTVAGEGPPPYSSDVRRQVERLGLNGCVSFIGKVAHEKMPELFRNQDILVFPSNREEGMPLTMVEAMLSGCAVITTGSGGAQEVADLAKLPTFRPEDPGSLSDLLIRLVTDPGEVGEIARRGQHAALEYFTLDRMITRFEATLKRLTGSP